MKNVEAIYESGVFRPLAALDAPEGTLVTVSIPEASRTDLMTDAEKEAQMAALDRILAIPLENNVPFSGEDHDEVLYGWKKSR